MPREPNAPRSPQGLYLPTGSQSKSARSRRKSRAARDNAIKQSLGIAADKTPSAQKVAARDIGLSGSWNGDTARARRALNLATLEGMLNAYRRGGQAAIDKVMKHSPAIFLKMLVLLVPRELEVTHSGSIKQMTDQQIEDAIAAIQAMLERRTIDVTPNKPAPDA